MSMDKTLSNLHGTSVVIANILVPSDNAATLKHVSYTPHIGAVCAREFARHGAHVFLIDADRLALERLSDQIEKEGGSATICVADPADPDALQEAARQCEAVGLPVRALINCHFDTELASIEASSYESWERV